MTDPKSAAVLEMIEQEEARRDQLVTDVRAAVAVVYVTGGDTDFLVNRSEVHRQVAEALGWRTMDGALISLVNAIVSGMGAVATAIGGRHVFLAMRRRDVDGKDARRASKLLRRLWRAKKARIKKRARLTEDEVVKWRERLAAEGLGEIGWLPRKVTASRARNEDGAIHTDGVRRQQRTTQAEIYGAANDRVVDMLAEAEMEVAVLRLRAQGLALRPIAIKLGIDKMTVDAILKRALARRQTSDPGV